MACMAWHGMEFAQSACAPSGSGWSEWHGPERRHDCFSVYFAKQASRPARRRQSASQCILPKRPRPTLRERSDPVVCGLGLMLMPNGKRKGKAGHSSESRCDVMIKRESAAAFRHLPSFPFRPFVCVIVLFCLVSQAGRALTERGRGAGYQTVSAATLSFSLALVIERGTPSRFGARDCFSGSTVDTGFRPIVDACQVERGQRSKGDVGARGDRAAQDAKRRTDGGPGGVSVHVCAAPAPTPSR